MGLFFALIILYFSSWKVQSIEVTIGEQYYHAKVVQEYENYGSVTLFRYPVPEAVGYAEWTFFMIKEQESCSDKDYYVSMLPGGLPIVNPYNTSYPQDMYVHHAEGFDFMLPGNSSDFIHRVSVPAPIAGNWFVIAYRLKAGDDEKIGQKGIGTDCYYLLQTTLLFTRLIDIPILGELSNNAYRLSTKDHYALFRYQTKFSASTLKFEITGCKGTLQNKTFSGHCPVNLTVGAASIPLDVNPLICLKQSLCFILVNKPLRDTWYYLRVGKAIQETQYDISFNIVVIEEECDYSKMSTIYSLYDGNIVARDVSQSDNDIIVEERDLSVNSLNLSLEELFSINQESRDYLGTISLMHTKATKSCAPLYPLVTAVSSSTLSKHYMRLKTNNTNQFPVIDQMPIVMSLYIDPVEDIGGTLQITIEAPLLPNPVLKLCIKQMGPPLENGDTLSCNETGMLERNMTTSTKVKWHMPFPAAGEWYLALQVDCYNDTWQSSSCGDDAIINVDIELGVCINNCGPNNQCLKKIEDGTQFFVCRCQYGYRGFGCTDESEAWSRGYFLARVLLLTLSNVIFLVVTIFAIYRYHFAESVSYFATAIFSTLYHSCDSSPVCVLNYDTLQFCDFYASFMSLLLTLIAMAKLNHSLKSTLHITGAFLLAFAAKYDRFSLWAVGVPLTSGLIVLLSSWGCKMYKRRTLYPSKRRWILFIVPGAILAIIGLVFTTALETENNYFVTHSIWHICMGASVLFLLPPRSKRKEDSTESQRELLDVNSQRSDYSTVGQESCDPYSFNTGE